MPVQKRAIKQYNSDFTHLNAETFIELIEKLSDEFSPSPILSTQIMIQYDQTQINGEIKEVKTLLEEIDAKEKPYAFNANITTNDNPRKMLFVNVIFKQSLVSLNLQNINQDKSQALIDILTNALPESHEFQNETLKVKENVHASIKEDKREFLPGAFRPIPMPALSDKDVFVVMSFERSYRDTYELAIKPTIEKFGFNPIKADQIQHNTIGSLEVVRQIEKAIFIVADLTGERQNVYYEIGYAHRADKEVILISQEKSPVHFDVAGISRINYADLTELRELLSKRIQAIIDKNQ